MGNIRIVLSASKIDTYKQCARRYWYQYIKKLPRQKLNVYQIRGKFVHVILEEWVLLLMEGVPCREAMRVAYVKVYNSWRNSRIKSLSVLKIQDIKQWLRPFIAQYERQPFTPLEVEQDIGFEYRGIKLNGKFDRIDKIDSDTIKIIDYKAVSSPSNLKPLQLALYHLSVKHGSLRKKYGDKQIETAYVLLKHKLREKVFRFTREELEQVLDELEDIAERILGDKEFRPCEKVGLCRYCDYYFECIPKNPMWKL